MGDYYKGLDDTTWKQHCEISQRYGAVNQKAKLLEELAELKEVVVEDFRTKGEDRTEAWLKEMHNKYLTEIADVEILIRQLIRFVGITETEIREEFVRKVNRQTERIRNGTDNNGKPKKVRYVTSEKKPLKQPENREKSYSFSDLMRDQFAEEYAEGIKRHKAKKQGKHRHRT